MLTSLDYNDHSAFTVLSQIFMFKTKPELVAFFDEHSRTRQQTLSPKYKATSKLTPHLPNKSLIIFALGFPYGVDQNLADWLPEPIQERRRPFLV